MPAWLRVLLPLIVLAGPACGPDRVSLGSDPNYLWWSDFEAAGFADWTSAAGGTGLTQASGSGRLDEARAPEPVRSGSRAMHAALGPYAGPYAHALVTRGTLPVEAWYTAWFFLPRAPEAKPFLTLFKLSARTGPEVVDVVATHPDGSVAPHVAYLDSTQSLDPSTPVTLPIARWFAIEAFVRLATDGSGAFDVYLDGQRLGHAEGAVIATDQAVEWTLGPITVDTPGLDVYVDDASITRRRLGPTAKPLAP